jgi:hypothetical protein
MMGQHDRSEALFYYFRLEDQIPETHLAGGPALTIPACTIPCEGAPSLRFLQGWVAMMRVLLILLWIVGRTQMALALPAPAPSQKTRRNGAPTVLVRPA